MALLIKILFFFLSFSSVLSTIRISNNNILIDDKITMFHGVNAVVKGYPFVPINNHFDPFISLSKEDFELMNKYGINLIRLGILWQGAEPSKGNYNITYLDLVRN